MYQIKNQAAFNKVCKHLNEQQEQSRDGEGESCRMRGDEGRKCAIGCLIPNSEYDEDLLEGELNPDTIKMHVRALWKVDSSLLRAMQRVHDLHRVSEWNKELRIVADIFGLGMPECIKENKEVLSCL
jgi:hypothetical protein